LVQQWEASVKASASSASSTAFLRSPSKCRCLTIVY